MNWTGGERTRLTKTAKTQDHVRRYQQTQRNKPTETSTNINDLFPGLETMEILPKRDLVLPAVNARGNDLAFLTFKRLEIPPESIVPEEWHSLLSIDPSILEEDSKSFKDAMSMKWKDDKRREQKVHESRWLKGHGNGENNPINVELDRENTESGTNSVELGTDNELENDNNEFETMNENSIDFKSLKSWKSYLSSYLSDIKGTLREKVETSTTEERIFKLEIAVQRLYLLIKGLYDE